MKVLVVGIGGYGTSYMKYLLFDEKGKKYEIVGTVDPYADKGEIVEELNKRNIPIYKTLEEFYENHTADAAIISTPIHLHAAQSAYCMEHGSHVLCEKPISATLDDAMYMIDVKNRTGYKLAIGFQWSFSDSILHLKKDILDGVYGKIQQIRTIALFPRDVSYYNRGAGWAGKRRMPSGEFVLDSVASNATAHYLHNMLFLTGDAIDRSAEPVSLSAEVYRANPIEMYDTCAMRIYTKHNVELLFYASHAIPSEHQHRPDFVIQGEKGTVIGNENGITGKLNNGQVIDYGVPCFDKLQSFADAVLNDTPLPCVVETALPHLKCTCSIADSFLETPQFAEEYMHYDEERNQYTCLGLKDVLERCWHEGKLPFELEIPWAKEPHKICF